MPSYLEWLSSLIPKIKPSEESFAIGGTGPGGLAKDSGHSPTLPFAIGGTGPGGLAKDSGITPTLPATGGSGPGGLAKDSGITPTLPANGGTGPGGLAKDSGSNPEFADLVKDFREWRQGRGENFPGLVYNIGENAIDSTGNWAKGAVQGAREQIKQERALRKIAVVDGFGNAIPRPGVSPEEVAAQAALTKRANTNFANETVMPVLKALALVNPGADLLVSAIEAKEAYDKGGVGNVVKELSGYNAGREVLQDPEEFGRQFYKKPLTASSKFLPYILQTKSVYRGARNRITPKK